jgi:hypothetical protein
MAHLWGNVQGATKWWVVRKAASSFKNRGRAEAAHRIVI